jgi:hypothetical protein
VIPSIGRIVHYTTGRSGADHPHCEAAIVTVVRDPLTVDVVVFGAGGVVRSVQRLPSVDATYPPGEPDIEGWHVPEYVPQPKDAA